MDEQVMNFGGNYFRVKIKKDKKKGGSAGAAASSDAAAAGDTAAAPRRICGCEGTTHKVAINCLSCGRIHCEAERVIDPVTHDYLSCLFCGEKLVNAFAPTTTTAATDDASLTKLAQHRDRLLAQDASKTANFVIDDQMDYYESDNSRWMSAAEKQERKQVEEKLKTELNKAKKTMQLTIDMSGKISVGLPDSENPEVARLKQQLQRSFSPAETTAAAPAATTSSSGSIVNPFLVNAQQNPLKFVGKIMPQSTLSCLAPRVAQHAFFDDTEGSSVDQGFAPLSASNQLNTYDDSHIVYEEPISKDSEDEGMCLSMHQPWASLLVCGVKLHEGRTWNTEYRGRLWIASTQQECSEETIEELRDFYAQFNRAHLFPREFPSGVILGCVDLRDCLSHEDYVKQVPQDEQESESDYVFMCKNPRRLYVPIANLGKPYIYKLEGEQTLAQCHAGLRPIDPARIIASPSSTQATASSSSQKKKK